jgi:hypothetical protein
MKEIEMLSLCALIGLSGASQGCTSKQAAAEAQTAEAFQPAENDAAKPATASTEPPPPANEPSTAEDDTWTEEPAAGGETTPPPAAEQAETRTMDVIRQFVMERREKVRPCYDKVQASRPNLKGDVMMRFILSPSGMVQKIEYSESESTIFSKEIGDCIAAEMKTWQFPASSRGMETKVGYPFNFNPRKK